MFLDLLTAPLLAPVTGLSWIGEQILEQSGSALDAKENLQKQLLALQLSFDMGDLSEADFESQEEDLLLAIDAIEQDEEV